MKGKIMTRKIYPRKPYVSQKRLISKVDQRIIFTAIAYVFNLWSETRVKKANEQISISLERTYRILGAKKTTHKLIVRHIIFRFFNRTFKGFYIPGKEPAFSKFITKEPAEIQMNEEEYAIFNAIAQKHLMFSKKVRNHVMSVKEKDFMNDINISGTTIIIGDEEFDFSEITREEEVKLASIIAQIKELSDVSLERTMEKAKQEEDAERASMMEEELIEEEKQREKFIENASSIREIVLTDKLVDAVIADINPLQKI